MLEPAQATTLTQTNSNTQQVDAASLATAITRCPLRSHAGGNWRIEVLDSIASNTAAACRKNVSGMPYLRTVTSADGSGVITTYDEGLARRLKALACTAPLHDIDVRAKRNLALMLGYMVGWSRVLFLDDDITELDPGDMRVAGSLLDGHNAVGFRNDGYPDTSVVCHAYRMAGVRQQVFVGSGALAVELTRNRSFFPDIYNDDWFFLLDGDRHLQPMTVKGRINQHTYDPFRSPDRARNEELGEVLAEGLYWLMDQNRSISEADQECWSSFCPGAFSSFAASWTWWERLLLILMKEIARSPHCEAPWTVTC